MCRRVLPGDGLCEMVEGKIITLRVVKAKSAQDVVIPPTTVTEVHRLHS